jgi:hypothetical protein
MGCSKNLSSGSIKPRNQWVSLDLFQRESRKVLFGLNIDGSASKRVQFREV